MAYKQSKNPFGKSPLNFNSPLNSFDSLVGKLMNQGKSKEAATKIAGKVANAKMKGAGSGPTAAQKARAKGSPAKQAKPDFLDLDKDGNTTEPMKDAAKSSPANLKEKSPAKLKEKSPAKLKSPAEKKLVGKQKNLPEGLKKAIEAAPESPAKMKSPMKKHSDAHIRKEAKRIARKNKGDEQDIYYELKSKYAQEKKDAAKKAKDAAKDSPAKLAKKEDKTKKKEGKATKVIKDRKKTADLLNAKNPPKKKDSPANLKGVVKGAEKVAKIAKRAKPQQIARQAKLVADTSGEALKTAIAGAAGYIAGKGGFSSDKRAKTGIISSKKKSPLNNAYENPEYFVPTKSSYGQDMDNFFNTVNQTYEDRKRYGKSLKDMKGDPLSNMSDEDINSLFNRIQEVRNKNKNEKTN